MAQTSDPRSHDHASDGPRMPGDADHGDQTRPQVPTSPSGSTLPPPPSFTRQIGQLFIIPAVIVIICIGLAVLFGKLAGSTESLESQLRKLEQDSGAGRMAFNLQDPRYKDRGLAAYNIATLIPSIREPHKRKEISDRLIRILNDNVGPDEGYLHVYLLTAIGQLGQEGGLAEIQRWFTAGHTMSRQGAVRGLLSWPDDGHGEPHDLVPGLVGLLRDEALVASEAAAALGQLGHADDAPTIRALRDAMGRSGVENREVTWNAAVALARLGDTYGVRFVVEELLDREALGKLPAAESGRRAQETMDSDQQTRVMLATLTAAADMTDEAVWDKIAYLADNDSNLVVRRQARLLMQHRGRE